MTITELKDRIRSGGIDAALTEQLAVPAERLESERERYAGAAGAFLDLYGEGDVSLYSVSGRSEIGGNHTDHNHGRVIAAAVNLDVLAVAAKREGGRIRIKSEGFPEDVVERAAAEKPDKSKFFTSEAIIAGMERAFLDAGYQVGGFDAYTTSNVLKGSGISSSAAFEVMVGNILNHLYNDGKVDNVEIAKMAQFAENRFFGKPCGLMDQMACAVGGFIAIDFRDPKEPVIEKVPFDLKKAGYRLCIVNTGGNHADLNEDYASVPAEMKGVADRLGVRVLRETTLGGLDGLVNQQGRHIREKVGDRALLRAYHFFAENERVVKETAALKSGDFDAFLDLVRASGRSSFMYCQNVYTTKNPREQGLSLALCLTERFTEENGGACRVHGGGFAGTIQAFIRAENVRAYVDEMENVFGDGCCFVFEIRQAGACRIL